MLSRPGNPQAAADKEPPRNLGSGTANAMQQAAGLIPSLPATWCGGSGGSAALPAGGTRGRGDAVALRGGGGEDTGTHGHGDTPRTPGAGSELALNSFPVGFPPPAPCPAGGGGVHGGARTRVGRCVEGLGGGRRGGVERGRQRSRPPPSAAEKQRRFGAGRLAPRTPRPSLSLPISPYPPPPSLSPHTQPTPGSPRTHGSLLAAAPGSTPCNHRLLLHRLGGYKLF